MVGILMRGRAWRAARSGPVLAIAAVLMVLSVSSSVEAQVLQGRGPCRIQTPQGWDTLNWPQSFMGCAGWVYAFALRSGMPTLAMWRGSILVRVNTQGIVYWALESNAPEWRRWGTNGNNYMGELLDSAVEDINAFWAGVFTQIGRPYFRPARIVSYEGAIRTGCGISRPGNALYCANDRSIYFHMQFFRQQLTLDGGFAPVVILAHEWGHHIQLLLGIFDSHNTKGVELQADCFAGTFTAYAENKGLLDAGDVRSATINLFSAGDRQTAEWFKPGIHGTGDERVGAFVVGLQEGINGCRRLR